LFVVVLKNRIAGEDLLGGFEATVLIRFWNLLATICSTNHKVDAKQIFMLCLHLYLHICTYVSTYICNT
jgi:hypothetical protein